MADQTQSLNLIPNTDNSLELGSNSLRWSDVYAVEFHGTATYSGTTLSVNNHELGNLGDVSLSSVSTGDVLVWSGTEWTANSVCNPTQLDNLTNVDAPAPTNGQVLRYNGTTGKWEAESLSPASIGTTFISLSDTPSVLTAGTFLKVNAGGNAVETFADPGYVSNLSSFSTTNLAEGTNLYYTDARFDTRLASKTTDNLTEGTKKYFTNANFDTRLSSKTTADLTEGSNLYYTNARFDTRFGTKSTTNLSEGSNLYYTDARFDTRFSTKTTNDLTEGTNLYYTDTRFDTRLGTKTTDNLTEGSTNLYYTDTRVNNRVANLSISSLSDVDTSGVANNKILKYNSTAGRWEVGDDNVPVTIDWSNVSNKPAIPSDTDTVSEGSTNLYFTNARADARIAAASIFDLSNVPSTLPLSNTNPHAVAKLNANKDGVDFVQVGSTTYTPSSLYPNGLVLWSAGNLGVTLEYYPPTEAGMLTLLGSSLNTTNVSEGTNLYYTDARVNNRIASSSLSDLSGVNVIGATNGQALTYTSSNATWKAETLDITKLSDVNLSRPLSKGQALRYNGSNWDNDPSASVNKHNNGNAVSGLHTVDLDYQRYQYIQINGETRLKGSNWRSGVTYTIVIANNSGSSHLVHFRNDANTLEETPTDDSGNPIPLPTGYAFRLIVTSLGTSSNEALFSFELGELSPFFNSSNIGT